MDTRTKETEINALEHALFSAQTEGGMLAGRGFERDAAQNLDLSDLTFRQVRFDRCQFTGCDLSAAAFYDCVFDGCAFAGCRFASSFWKDSALSGCVLDGVTLSASCQELRGAKIHASQAAVVARILGIEIVE